MSSDVQSFDPDAGQRFVTNLERALDPFEQSIPIADLEASLKTYLDSDLLHLRNYLGDTRVSFAFTKGVVESLGAAPIIIHTGQGSVITVPIVNGQPNFDGLSDSDIEIAMDFITLNPGATGVTWIGGNDAGGTYDVEKRDGFFGDGESDLARGRNAVASMIDRTGDDQLINQDEFGIIKHKNGSYTVVLPGVTDLSSPDIGFNDRHRTVRDVDQAALASAGNNTIDSNLYAVMVEQWLQQQIIDGNIPQGANIMLVGHSYGGDTAIDLASDPEFNGELFNVTHVVSAAYASEHQLGDVPSNTEVLVLQNIYDVPVAVESLPHVGDGGARETARNIGRIGIEGLEDATGGLASGVNRVGDDIEEQVDRLPDIKNLPGVSSLPGADLLPSNPSVTIPHAPTDYTFVGDNRTGDGGALITEFDGGYDSLEHKGHHQDAYSGYLNRDGAENDQLNAFLASVGESGYGESGDAFAVDVSVRGHHDFWNEEIILDNFISNVNDAVPEPVVQPPIFWK